MCLGVDLFEFILLGVFFLFSLFLFLSFVGTIFTFPPTHSKVPVSPGGELLHMSSYPVSVGAAKGHFSVIWPGGWGACIPGSLGAVTIRKRESGQTITPRALHR